MLRELGLQLAQPGHELRAARGGVLDQLFLAHRPDGGDGGRARHDVAAERPAVAAGRPLGHQLLARGQARKRQARGDAFGHQQDVGDGRECSTAKNLPVRPKPDWTSSATSRMPCSSHSLRSSGRKPAGGTT